jgi:hypothetical protein
MRVCECDGALRRRTRIDVVGTPGATYLTDRGSIYSRKHPTANFMVPGSRHRSEPKVVQRGSYLDQ